MSLLPSALRDAGRLARVWRRIAAVLAMLAAPMPAFAIFSCDAGAGPTVSGGSGDSCGLNKYAVSVESILLGGNNVQYSGNAVTSLSNGAMAGSISIADGGVASNSVGPGNGMFYSNILVDFRISGPAAPSVPVTMITSITGTIGGDCTACEGNISFLSRVQGVGVLLEVTGGQTYFNGAASNWVINRNEIGAAGGTTVYVPGGGGTVTNFDASTVLNQDLRFTGNLSGSAAFTGQNAAGSSLSVNASNTGLFNLLLPAGYSIVANPSQVPWLATPTLTAPVPEPRSTALFAAGLAIAGLVARRRTRQVLRR